MININYKIINCDIVRKYYLFDINKEFYDVYKKNSYVIYKTLENLYNLKKENIKYGVTLFKQICNIIDKNYIHNLYSEYIRINNDKYLINENKEESVVTVRNPYVLYNTNMNFPPSMGKIYTANKFIFVVDFKNEDYFWLEDHIVLKSKYTLI